MIHIVIRFFGGLRIERGVYEQHLSLAEGSTIQNLHSALAEIGLNTEDKETAFVLDGYGLAHYPSDRLLTSGQVISIFPLISGG